MEANKQSRRGLAIAEAVELLLQYTKRQPTEYVSLMNSVGRVLAFDFYSQFPIPSFRKAAMDGYAVNFGDIEYASVENPALLQVTAEIRAGSVELPLGQHVSVRIYTGAPVSNQYDTVIMQEAVITMPDEIPFARFPFPSERGKHIAEIGEDISAGICVITQGTVISSKEIAILASFGIQNIEVFRKPIVAVIPIGDELQVPGETLRQYHLYESNGFMLEARLIESGADCKRYPPVPDDPICISQAIQAALLEADSIITSGGVSVGKYDYILQVMEDMSAVPLFTKVLMRPGAPTSAFLVKDKLSIHLSGNPSACFVGYELFVKPMLLFKSGCKTYGSEHIEAILDADVRKPCPYPRFLRSYAEIRKGVLYVTPLSKDMSGNIAAFAKANAMCLIPAGGSGAARGQIVQMQWI